MLYPKDEFHIFSLYSDKGKIEQAFAMERDAAIHRYPFLTGRRKFVIRHGNPEFPTCTYVFIHENDPVDQ